MVLAAGVVGLSLALTPSAFGYHHPSLGRWLSRDPIEYAEERNQYVYVKNNPEDLTDPYGEWWQNPSHADLTRQAMELAVPKWLVEFLGAQSCYDYALEIMIPANEDQDKGDAEKDLRRHYLRPVERLQGTGILVANADYAGYVYKEVAAFKATLASITKPCGTRKDDPACCEKCDDALETLGRVTHSWQDYFAHAVLRTTYKGSPAWSATPPITGTPDNRNPELVPASWSSRFRAIVGGQEHRVGEPGQEGEEEAPRVADANKFVATKFQEHLPPLYYVCKCCCE